jgi:hypothetical protein
MARHQVVTRGSDADCGILFGSNGGLRRLHSTARTIGARRGAAALMPAGQDGDEPREHIHREPGEASRREPDSQFVA